MQVCVVQKAHLGESNYAIYLNGSKILGTRQQMEGLPKSIQMPIYLSLNYK